MKNSKLKLPAMQFILIAYDDTDDEALQRRLNVRKEHLEKINVWKTIEIRNFHLAKIG
jgi:hypothetical protein